MMRNASKTSFPYGWPGRVSYFTVGGDGLPAQIRTRDEMRQAVAEALAGGRFIFAAWPGEFRTDLFLIDLPALLAEAIGLVIA